MNRAVLTRAVFSFQAFSIFILLFPVAGTSQPTYTLLGHTSEVLSVAFSPDGRYIASGSADRTIRIWDIQHGTVANVLSGHTNGVRSVAFSPDGQYLVSGSRDKTVKLWSLARGTIARTFSGHNAQVFSVAFSPDGKYIASGSDDNTVRIWDVQNGFPVKVFQHDDRVFAVAFSPDGKYVASACEDKLVRLWSLQSTGVLRTFSGHTNSVITVAFSPDGQYLASGSSDNSIRLWDVQTGDAVRQLSGHTDLVSSVAFSANGKYLVSAGFDDSIRLWEVNTGNLLKTLFGHMNTVISIAFSPDGAHVASGGEDKAALIWDIADYISEKSDLRFPPLLLIDGNTVLFKDSDGNDRLDAGELATVEFVITNKGKGMARGLRILHDITGTSQDITVVTSSIPTIDVGESQTITVILKAGVNMISGTAVLKLTIAEPNGLDSDPVEIEFNTLSFQAPNVIAADGIFSSETGGQLKFNHPANLEVLVQNTGTGTAEGITAEIQLPENVLSLDPAYQPIARLKPGETIRIKTEFIVTARYDQRDLPITIILKESRGAFGSQKIFVAHLDQPLASARVSVQGAVLSTTPIMMASLHSDVDKNIPLHEAAHANRFALVIGNEDYQRFQTGLQVEQNVSFARNDAMVFKEYLIRTMGFPEKQVFTLTDATRGQMGRELERLVELARITPHAEIMFYYAGHGLPEEQTRQAYLIPVDVTASSLKEGIRLSDLYKKLASSKADRVQVFLDACFSGGGRGENGLLAARTVKVKPKGDLVEGNVIVFTATSGEEVSLPLTRESHGLFTYCLLRKLKETEGNVTMQELQEYLANEMPKLSLLENSQKQTPQVLVAPPVTNQWQAWKW